MFLQQFSVNNTVHNMSTALSGIIYGGESGKIYNATDVNVTDFIGDLDRKSPSEEYWK